MRSDAMQALDVLVGTWQTTLTDAWFDLPPGSDEPTETTISWVADEAFVLVEWTSAGGGTTLCLGHSSSTDTYWALYHDERGVDRVFSMTFGDGQWTLLRADPDFHQRFVAQVSPGRIAGRWEASEDQGATWRKDFDLTFTRVEATRWVR